MKCTIASTVVPSVTFEGNVIIELSAGPHNKYKGQRVVVVVVMLSDVVSACTTKVLPFLQPSSASVVVLHDEYDEQPN
jgi:hypothetical protein